MRKLIKDGLNQVLWEADIEKLVSNFETLVYDLFAEDDFNKQNKIENKIELLVNKVYAQGLERLFYDKLFNSPDLFARIEIAIVSFNRNYDLYKSLEVLEQIKKDIDKLTVFDDPEKNKKWQDYFTKFSNLQLKEKIAFLEELNDEYLFKKYFECIALFDLYYDGYVLTKQAVMQTTKENIVIILNSVDDSGKLSRLLAILFTKAEESKSLIYLILINYFSLVMKYNPQTAIINLQGIVNKCADELNPKMLAFAKDRLNEMVSTNSGKL
ncbi:MAG: hypothetical protein ACI4MQ_04365 [Candidatus Coproplasma sp.]